MRPESHDEFSISTKNRVRQVAKRAAYDRPSVYQILDCSLICHVALVNENGPGIIPMLFARRADERTAWLTVRTSGTMSGCHASRNDGRVSVNGDHRIDLLDRDLWLAEAGSANLPSQAAYLVGDANLDGVVDGTDFIIWNANKFQLTGAWSRADFNADGYTDGVDFTIWNGNKFLSADALSAPRIDLAVLADEENPSGSDRGALVEKIFELEDPLFTVR